MRFALLLFAVGCVPELHSPDSALEQSDWEAPSNRWATSSPPAGLDAEGFSVGEVPPDMRLMDQFGDEVSLWQFYGSVVVVDVSTMWCAPCKILAQEVNETWHDYQEQGFMYLTLLPQNNVGEVPDQDDLNTWAEDFGIEAPVLADTLGFSDQISPDAQYPTLLVIDRDFQVAEDRVDPAEDATLRALVESLL